MVDPNQPNTEPYTGSERALRGSEGPVYRVTGCERRSYGYRFQHCHEHYLQRRQARKNREWWAKA
jgi:hypothetical protein